jgi:hypothetical protein
VIGFVDQQRRSSRHDPLLTCQGARSNGATPKHSVRQTIRDMYRKLASALQPIASSPARREANNAMM